MPEGVDARSDETVLNTLADYFDRNRERVYFSRQLEVAFESQWFHWITNRGLRMLIEQGLLVAEERTLSTGGSIHVMWHRGYRYPKREAARVVALVEEYAHPNIGASLDFKVRCSRSRVSLATSSCSTDVR